MQRRYILTLFVLVLLGLGLGYASLSTNLNITGTTILKDNRWDIHLENVQVKTGSVSATTPTINTAKDTVTYSVILNQPGDYYEFTIDAKNDGSIDGMISNVSSTLNNNPITNLPTALSYTLTYDDDIAISNNHSLPSGEKVTYKIRVAYRTDITAQDLPSTEQTLNFAFTVTYIQADSNAIPKPIPPAYYTVTNEYIFFGDSVNDIITYDNYNDAITAYGHPYFLKLGVDENDNVNAASAGFVLNDTVYYLQGAGSTYDDINGDWNNDSIYYETNKEVLLNAFGNSNCTEIQEPVNDYSYIICNSSGLYTGAYKNGYIQVLNNSIGCSITPGGTSSCSSN